MNPTQAQLNAALRHEIRQQRNRFAKSFARIVLCQECEKELHNTHSSKRFHHTYRGLERAQVDHNIHEGKTFIEMYRYFCKKIPNEELTITWLKKYKGKIPILTNRDTAKTWREYHKKHTTFRFLCCKCNNQTHNKAARIIKKRRKKKTKK